LRKFTILLIILILPLSELYRVPAAYCFQKASHPGVCTMAEHKTCSHDSCGLNRHSGVKSCGLAHHGNMKMDGRTCRTHIGCSHSDKSPLHLTLSDEDVYLPARTELASYYSILSYTRNSEITYEKEINFPIERPPAFKNI